MAKLRGKQPLFVEHYLKYWNATKAAKLAGYSGNYATLRSIGSENLTKPNIKAEIDRRLAEAAMSSNEVLARLTKMARGVDIAPYIKIKESYLINEDGKEYFSGYVLGLDMKTLQKDGFSHLIKKIKQSGKGLAIEWHDQRLALVDMGNAHQLFIKKVELAGKGGGPVKVIVIPDNRRDDRDTGGN